MEHGIAVHEVDGHTDGHHLHIRRELARVIAHHHRRGGRGPRLASPHFLQVHDGVLYNLVRRDRDLVDLPHATAAHLMILGVDDLAGNRRGGRVDDFPLDRASVGHRRSLIASAVVRGEQEAREEDRETEDAS